MKIFLKAAIYLFLGIVLMLCSSCVDLIINGDGAGQNGQLGTGNGGAASIDLAPGGFAIFTIDLTTDVAGGVMSLSWNTPPGWLVTFDGKNSPVANYPPGTYDLKVTVPQSALPGQYDVILDAWIEGMAFNYDSVLGRINVIAGAPPAKPDLVIDGSGLGVFGSPGSGAGGFSLRTADPGVLYSSTLRLVNAGAGSDSFYVWWEQPPGWPAGSILINDGTADRFSPFTTSVLTAGSFIDFTVKVQVPPTAPPALFTALFNTYARNSPLQGESVRLVTQTYALIRGVVFDDVDHDAVFSAGDRGIPGVKVSDALSAAVEISGGGGEFGFIIPGGASAYIMEKNPSGFISLNPDSAGPFAVQAGDTVDISFADVGPIDLSPGAVLLGLAGSYVDFPHSVTASTKGRVTVSAFSPSGGIIMIFLDANGSGGFDGTDRLLQPADGDLDPETGSGRLDVLVRLFIPGSSLAGQTLPVLVNAVQAIEGTALLSNADATDAAVVAGSSIGRLKLSKNTDKASAVPGDIVTYSIDFFNEGIDTIQNVIIFDPVSEFVDMVTDAFGPGKDLELQIPGSGARYLTMDPLDGDECEYRISENLLQVTFSKVSPLLILPGEKGSIVYKVRVQ